MDRAELKRAHSSSECNSSNDLPVHPPNSSSMMPGNTMGVISSSAAISLAVSAARSIGLVNSAATPHPSRLVASDRAWVRPLAVRCIPGIRPSRRVPTWSASPCRMIRITVMSVRPHFDSRIVAVSHGAIHHLDSDDLHRASYSCFNTCKYKQRV